jgi:O-antigen/teichoic acid export membrane protein
LSWQGTAAPIARSILAGWAWAAGAELETFLVIWFVTELAGELFLWFLAWRELKRRDLLSGIRPTLRPATLPGAWRFAIHVNLTGSLVTTWGPIARLVIGGLIGPAGAAVYRIAASLADAAQRPADLLAKAYYPEVVRMDLATSRPWKLMLRGTVLATAVGFLAVAVLAFGGRWLIDTIFGSEFLPAYPVLLVLIVAPLLGMLSFPLPPMLYALDRPDAPLKARLAGTILYFVIVAPLCWQFGVIGAAIAFVAANAVTVALLMLQLHREYRRVRTV